MKDIIRQILKEETEELGERTKLERVIASLFDISKLDDGVLLEPDNLYGIIVDIYDTDYGKQCHVTALMKKPFKREDSDMLQNMLRNNREKIKSMFSDFFSSGISSSVSTIESYKNNKWFYDEKKNQQ